jgi:hypothetical protein
MRKRTTQHYATIATQVERFPGGLSWDNPNNALAINGNVGATLPAITPISDGNWPLGPGYSFWTASTPQPDFVPSATDNQKFPNALRFSGFNINDAPSNSIVTNLYVKIQYRDDSTLSYTPRDGMPIGSNWLITPVKSGGIQLYRKRFKDVFGTSIKNYNARIPCSKDQSWATCTFGPGGIVPDTIQPGRRAVPIAKNNKIARGYNDYAFEYYDTTTEIESLTVAEINDSNFYIDIWHTHTPQSFLTLVGVKVYSISVDVEYIQPASKNITMYYKNSSPDYVRSIDLGFGYQERWTNIRAAGGFPTATLDEFNEVPGTMSGNYAYFNVFAKPYPIDDNGNVNDQLIKFDSDYMFGRMPAIADIDDTTNSISDIILDVRVNAGIYNYSPPTKWTYILSDGIGPEVIAQRKNVVGEVIYKYALQGRDAGTRDTFTGPGEPWLNWSGEYNLQDMEYYGGSQSGWTTKHIPIRLTDPLYVLYPTIVNNVKYPGAVYDPLWIEKALKSGNLYVGLVFTVDPGTSIYWNTQPHPTAWIKLDAVSLRVLYTPAGITPPPIPPPSEVVSDSGLIYRFTP